MLARVALSVAVGLIVLAIPATLIFDAYTAWIYLGFAALCVLVASVGNAADLWSGGDDAE